ncbi:MAG: hypothetical protein K2H18_02640 [Muribaculaceae bacterium]|nr:hypothetical protein [Muribaculaceae bacterium]
MTDSTPSLRYSNEKADERANALKALEKMKEIERKKAARMRSLRIDSRTIISSTPRRLKHLKAELLKGSTPELRGVALKC